MYFWIFIVKISYIYFPISAHFLNESYSGFGGPLRESHVLMVQKCPIWSDRVSEWRGNITNYHKLRVKSVRPINSLVEGPPFRKVVSSNTALKRREEYLSL